MLCLLPAATSAAGSEPLRGEWHLDESCAAAPCAFADTSGNGLTGTQTGTVTGHVSDGRFGGAAAFPAVIDAGNSALLQPAHITVVAWVRDPTTPGPVKAIVAQGADGTCSYASYALYTGYPGDPDPGLHFYFWNGSQIVRSPGANTIWDGQWHMVAGTYDGSFVRLYVDGHEVGSGTAGTGDIRYGLTGNANANNDFRIGSGGDPACSPTDTRFPGNIDETRVYSRALTASEISTLASSSATTPPELPPDSSGTPAPAPAPPAAPPAPTASFQTPSATSPSRPLILDASASANASKLVWSVNGTGDATCPGSQPYLGLGVDNAGTLGGAHASASPLVTLTAFGAGGIASTATHPLLTATTGGLPTSVARTVPETAICASSSSIFSSTVLSGTKALLSCTPMTITFDIVEIRGCFASASSRSQVPVPEQSLWDDYQSGVNASIASCKAARNPLIPPGLCSIDVTRTIGGAQIDNHLYVATSPVTVNGVTVTPGYGGAVVVSPFLERLVSAAAKMSFGGIPLNPPPPLPGSSVDLDLHSVSAPQWLTGASRAARTVTIASFDASKDLPSIGGFSIDGQIDIALVRDQAHRYSAAHLRLALPGDFAVFNGQPPTGEVQVNADNDSPPALDDLNLSVPEAELGPVTLSNVAFVYHRNGQPGPPFNCNGNFWKATAEIFIGSQDPSDGQAGISLTDQPPYPPNAPQNGFGWCGSTFSHAGGSVIFGGPIPKPEVFPGVSIDDVNLGVQLHPALLRGGITMDVADLVQVHGDLLSVLASSGAPYILTSADGPGFANLPGGSLSTTSTTIAAGGAASFLVPGLGPIPLASGYAVYEYPDYLAFGGSATFGVPDVSIGGRIDGQLSVHEQRFNLQGQVGVCFTGGILKDALGCGLTLDAWLSDRGFAICVGDPGSDGWHPGFGWKWGLNLPEIWFPDGCKPSHYWDHSIAAPSSAHTASAGLTFTVAKGETDKTVRLVGAGAPPQVSVKSPDGETISTAEGNFVHHGTLGVLRSDLDDATYVGVLGGKRGTYTITELPGSAPITVLGQTRPGGTQLTASVSGRGLTRTLHYALGSLTGRAVSFFERGGATFHLIGAATAASGALSFTPAAAGGRSSRAAWSTA
jgi:hypothetical protein